MHPDNPAGPNFHGTPPPGFPFPATQPSPAQQHPQWGSGPTGPVLGSGRTGLFPGDDPVRHPWEIPLLVVTVLLTAIVYTVAILALALGVVSTWLLIVLIAPIALAIGRGQLYGSQQVNGVKMSPTQFPDGYWMVAEAAARFGMRTPPDAYVVLGNGQINAFASGHGFRRFVVVYSDMFEIGGQAREPEALSFIIGHEVGHIAAGHASYWRQLGQFAANYFPVVGPALYRSMEYTADNHGYCVRPQGARGAMGVLGAGKYLVSLVGFDELADRATTERGFFPWLVNLMSGHPVLTWRAAALRNRTRHGSLFVKPSQIYR